MVDFHSRMIFTCMYKHVNFAHANKIETRYEVMRSNVMLSLVQL